LSIKETLVEKSFHMFDPKTETYGSSREVKRFLVKFKTTLIHARAMSMT